MFGFTPVLPPLMRGEITDRSDANHSGIYERLMISWGLYASVNSSRAPSTPLLGGHVQHEEFPRVPLDVPSARAYFATRIDADGLPVGALISGSLAFSGAITSEEPTDRATASLQIRDFEDRLLSEVRVFDDDDGAIRTRTLACPDPDAPDLCITEEFAGWPGALTLPIYHRYVPGNGLFVAYRATAMRAGPGPAIPRSDFRADQLRLTAPEGVHVIVQPGLREYHTPPRFDGRLTPLVSQVDPDYLRQHVAALEGQRHTADQIADAAAYIQSELERFGYTVALEATPAGPNVVAKLVGSRAPSRSFVLGAHYDTVLGSPGADDNASGVAGMLEIARILSGSDLEATVELVAFAGEERGLVGSKQYASNARLAARDLIGMISLEMIGYRCTTRGCQFPFYTIGGCFEVSEELRAQGDYLGIVGDKRSSWLAKDSRTLAGYHVPNLPVLTGIVEVYGDCLEDTRRSDHAAFWDQVYRAILITDTANFRNPNYHTGNDTLDTLDFDFMADATRAALAIVVSRSVLQAPCGRAVDSDADGACDAGDNCTLVANADQRDADSDGFGNLCDADLNDDGVVNLVDLAAFRARFLSGDPVADFDGDGVVSLTDLAIFKASFLRSPGPSGRVQ